jgi:hypothetical protein
MAIITNSKAKKLYRLVRYQGGFTYDLNRGIYPTTGYVVSIFPEHGQTYSDSEFSPQDIHRYLSEHSDTLAQEHVCLGAWRDNGIVYLDCVVVLEDKDLAISLGEEFFQLAIFDLNTYTDIFV